MAIDPQAILQLLTQFQGGGGPPIFPVSGLGGGTPLSGLPLGEQGMGVGGGGSLLGGSPGVGGGAEGPGLDILTLLNQLTQGGGVGQGAAPALGQPTGGGMGQGFGAGGMLQPQQGGVPQGTLGQAGMGGGGSAGQALSFVKELLGLGKALTPSQQGATTASPTVPGDLLPDALRSLGIEGTPFVPDVVGTAARGGSVAPAGFDLTRTSPFQIDPGILSGASGGGLASLGAVQSPAAIAAPFLAGGGPESVGQLAGAVSPDLFSQLGGVGGALGIGGAGLGTALNFAQGNIPGGVGSLAGAGVGALLAPETLGLSLALGAGGGGLLGSLFGGLFGGGHTQGSDVFLPGFSAPIHTRTAGGTQTLLRSFQEGTGAVGPFEHAVQAAQTPEALVAAFNQQYSPIPGQFRVESHGPGPFVPQQGATTSPGAFNFFNLGGTPFAPAWTPFTRASLMDPAVIANLDIQAGALGSPAEQAPVEAAVRQYLTSLRDTPFWGA